MANSNVNPANPGALPTFGLQPIAATGATDYSLPKEGAGAELWRKELGEVGKTVGEWAAQSAKADAEQAGKIAGLDPNYRPGSEPLLQGAAYRAAALKTYSAQLETKSRAGMEAVYRDWINQPASARDPAKLVGAMQRAKADIAKADVFPEVRAQFETGWDALQGAYHRAALDDLEKRQLDGARAAAIANLTSISDTGHRMATLPGPDGDKQSAAQIAAYGRQLDLAVDQGQYTATQAQEMKERFRQSVSVTRVKTTFDALPLAEKPASLERFKQAYGAGDYFATLRQKESGGNDAAQAAKGGAAGRYQFIKDTWSRLAKAHPQLGLTPQGRLDPDQQEKAVRALTADNGAALRAAGVDASPGNLYMAHFLGANGATKFLAAMAKNPDAPAAELFAKEAAANPTIFNGRTLRQVYELQTKTFDQPKTGGLSSDSFETLVGYMERSVAADAHEAERARRAGVAEIDAAKKQIVSGFDVGDAAFAQLGQRYAASPDPETRAAFEQASKLRGLISGFVGKPPSDIEARVASLRAGLKNGATPQQQELVEGASKWLDAYRKDLAENPVGRYARDFGAPVAPLDFSNGGALAQSLRDRLPLADQAAKAYGLPRARLLGEADKAAFKSLAAAGGPKMIEAAGAAMQALGPRGADLLREIGGDAPVFAAAARVSAWGGDKGFLNDFGEYHRLANDPAMKDALKEPKSDAADAELSNALGTSLLALPDLAASARVAGLQTYMLRAFRNGWDRSLSTEAATGALRRSVNEALGASYDGDVQWGGLAARRAGGWWGGHNETLLLPGTIRADKVGDVLAAIGDDDLKGNPPLYDDNRPASARAVVGGFLLSVGRGRYEVYSAAPLTKDAKPLRGRDGRPWVLDLNALEPSLRPRVPGAWR